MNYLAGQIVHPNCAESVTPLSNEEQLVVNNFSKRFEEAGFNIFTPAPPCMLDPAVIEALQSAVRYLDRRADHDTLFEGPRYAGIREAARLVRGLYEKNK